MKHLPIADIEQKIHWGCILSNQEKSQYYAKKLITRLRRYNSWLRKNYYSLLVDYKQLCIKNKKLINENERLMNENCALQEENTELIRSLYDNETVDNNEILVNDKNVINNNYYDESSNLSYNYDEDIEL